MEEKLVVKRQKKWLNIPGRQKRYLDRQSPGLRARA